MTASSEVITISSNTHVKRHHAWWLLVLLVVCIPAVLVGTAFSDTMTQILPETLPFPSTYNNKASGYSALYELCQKTGVKTMRWESPYRQLLKQKVKGTLVIALPWETLGRTDIDNLCKWVEEGNDLVYLDYLTYRSGSRLLEKLKMRAMMRSQVKDKDFVAEAKVAETGNATSLRVTSEAVVEGGNKVVGPDDKSFISWTTLGKGRCLIGSVPELCSNKYIAVPGYRNNFQFMINWFDTSKQPIIFDEKCHGFSSGTNVWFFILKSPVGFVLLQLGFIALIAFISLNQRFGQARLVLNARKISNLEFIDGLASTYQRARARDTAWAMMFTPLKHRLCKTLGVAPDAPLERLAAAWAESTGKREADYLDFLEKAQRALERESLSDEELNNLIATADKLTADSRELQPVRRVMGA